MNEMPEVANVPIATQNSSDVDALGTGAATPGADGATTEQTNLTTALSAIAASRYYYMVFSVEDATKLGVIQTHIATKSQPIPGLRSVGIAASPLALATVQTLANGRNYERLQIVWQKNSEATREVLAANMAAIRQKYEQLDSAYNFDFYSNKGDWLIPACYRDADRPSGDDQNDAITDGITVVVLDEADEMLDMGFAEDLEAILGATPRDRQTIDRRRIGMVVEFLQPAGQLGELGLVVLRQQPLGPDIAHQRLVAEAGNLCIGLRPVAGCLFLEDAAVAIAIVVAQYRRQVGRRRNLVELDDRGRRHEYGRPGRRPKARILLNGFGCRRGGRWFRRGRGLGGRLRRLGQASHRQCGHRPHDGHKKDSVHGVTVV